MPDLADLDLKRLTAVNHAIVMEVLLRLAAGNIAEGLPLIISPVLSAFGERDVSEDPRMEHKAFRHAVDFSSFMIQNNRDFGPLRWGQIRA